MDAVACVVDPVVGGAGHGAGDVGVLMPFSQDEIESVANEALRFYAPRIRAARRPWWANPWGAFRRWRGWRHRAKQYAELQAELDEAYRRLNEGAEGDRNALIGEALRLTFKLGSMKLNDQLYGDDSARPVRFGEL